MAGPIPTKRIPQLTDYGVPLGGTELFELWVVNTSRRVTAREFVLPAVDALIMAVDMSSTHPASRYLTPGTGIQMLDNGPGQDFVISMLGTGALPGNPTALVGLTPVNGVALSWMRSDAAPALDQSIAPTWTGVHTYDTGPIFNAIATFNTTGLFAAVGTNAVPSLRIASTSPLWMIEETDAAVDNRLWRNQASGEQLQFSVLNDALNVATEWMTVDRTATTIDIINLISTQLLWNGAPIAGGVIGLANPTASVGLTAVNGIAVTAMRSDAAPPLDQAIAPTWTGIHTHAAAVRGNRVAHTTAAAQALDLATANCFYETLGDNTAFSFTNPPAAGREMTFTIYLLQDGVGTRIPTWPASVHWSDGITPVLTTTANRLDAVTLTTVDGGVTYYGGQVLANMVP